MTELATPSPRAGCGGPKTAEGKARSAMNALKHGLRARRFVLLPDEDPEEFQALVEELADDLRPVGRSEVELVGKIAAAIWKESRGDRMKGELLARLGGGEGPGTLGRVMARECWGEHELGRVVRYQGYAGAQLTRAMAELRARQAERRALAAAGGVPPARATEDAVLEPAPESERTQPPMPASDGEVSARPESERTPAATEAAPSPHSPAANDDEAASGPGGPDDRRRTPVAGPARETVILETGVVADGETVRAYEPRRRPREPRHASA